MTLGAPDEKNQSVYPVTGGAGFIGSRLIDDLLAPGDERGPRARQFFLRLPRTSGTPRPGPAPENFTLDLPGLEKAPPRFAGVKQVFDLAANADARWGIESARLDLEQGIITT